MFCQSCGSKNSPDAKFCNQCGTKIAQAGDAGGPLAPAVTAEGPGPGAAAPTTPPISAAPAKAPAASASAPGGPGTSGGYGGPSPYGGEASMMSVSLAAIGVKSSKKVWVMIAVIAVVLIAAGALGSWLLRGDPEVVAEAGHAEPEDPFVIGTPLPEGEEAPPAEDGVDVVPGTTRMGSGASDMRTSTMRSTSGSSMRTSSMESAGSGSSGSGSSGSTMESAASSGSTGSSGSGSSGSTMTGSGSSGMSSGSSSTGTGTGSSDPEPDTTMTDTTMGSSMTSTMLPTEAPEETDLELELYGSRVRFVVRRYYAARAQACFDRATRNNPNVSGTVVVNMTIGADGAVSRTSVARNTTGDTTLGNCLSSQVSTWRLPPPPGGSLQMQMPFSR